jgi:hypothetical protein
MRTRPIDAADAPAVPPDRAYAQALEVSGAQRLLFISGQTPGTARRQPAGGLRRAVPASLGERRGAAPPPA